MSDETVTGAETTRENDDGREVLRRVRRRGVSFGYIYFFDGDTDRVIDRFY